MKRFFILIGLLLAVSGTLNAEEYNWSEWIALHRYRGQAVIEARSKSKLLDSGSWRHTIQIKNNSKWDSKIWGFTFNSKKQNTEAHFTSGKATSDTWFINNAHPRNANYFWDDIQFKYQGDWLSTKALES